MCNFFRSPPLLKNPAYGWILAFGEQSEPPRVSKGVAFVSFWGGPEGNRNPLRRVLCSLSAAQQKVSAPRRHEPRTITVSSFPEQNRETEKNPFPKIEKGTSKQILTAYCEQENVTRMEAARRGVKKLKEDLKK